MPGGIRTLVLVVVASLGLVACGRDGESSGSTGIVDESTSATGPTATPATEG